MVTSAVNPCSTRKVAMQAGAGRSTRGNQMRKQTAPFSSVRPVVRADRSSTYATSSRAVAMQAKDKKTIIITGTSSGLGLHAAKHLAKSGDWHIIMANRDYAKTLTSAQKMGIPRDSFTYLQCDLAAFESVRKFVDDFKALGRPLDALVCNAAVYLPVDPEPTFSADGYEMSVAVNHLGHFLLVNLLLEDLAKSDYKRCCIIGSITGNRNTLAGNIPPQADLGQLEGLEAGFKYPNVMINAGDWEAPKAYKDAKVCNMLTMRELDRRYAKESGITFSSLYPGCIAETGLFRNHVKAFQKLFPVFQKNITQGYVSEDEAGRRLAAVMSSDDYKQSGAYWSWSNDSEAFVNTLSEEAQDERKAQRLWDLSERLCGVTAPSLANAKSAQKEPAMA